MRQISQLKRVYTKPVSWILSISGAILISAFMFLFTSFEEIYGNLGPVYLEVLIISQVLIGLLFGMNITLLFDRFAQTGKFKKKEGITSTLFSTLSLLVAGCPACGITLASYLGLATFFGALPFFGLEIKIITIILLAWINWSLLKPVQCKI